MSRATDHQPGTTVASAHTGIYGAAAVVSRIRSASTALV